jgi:hypothetical protein
MATKSLEAAGLLAPAECHVNFPALQPASIVAQHPERRPDPLSKWQLHAFFDPPILEFLQTLSF